MSTHSIDIKNQLAIVKKSSSEKFKKYWEVIVRYLRYFADALLGRRASPIHLVEARERFSTLNAIINYHEEMVKENKLANHPDKIRATQSCRLELDNAEALLSRDQKELNELWRILTRVRNMILEKILDDNGLIQQLDFCREEAFRLGIAQEPVVSDMLQKLAEATNEDDVCHEKIKRHVRALNERFNTIRTDRIFDQYIKMRTYKTALLFLSLLSIVIIVLTPVLIDFKESEKAIKATLFPDYTFSLSGSLVDVIVNAIVYHVGYIVALCKTNVLAFVFISGLIGGFFSVVLRVRTHNRVAGDDAYFRLYVLSRPLIGALGAMIVYVLFMGGFVTVELVDQLGRAPEPKVFGFAFLSGFSERVMFPNFQ